MKLKRYLGKIRTSRKQKIYATIPEAARILECDKFVLYHDQRRGRLLTTAHIDKHSNQFLSWQELREYAKTRGVELWNVPVTAEFAYIGRAFRPRAKRKVAAWDDSITLLLRKYPGFDGTLFIAAGSLDSVTEEELEFVCQNLFSYNQIITRYRPFAVPRHVYVCWDARSRKRADQLCDLMQGRYPGVMQAIPLTHLRRVQAFKENTND